MFRTSQITIALFLCVSLATPSGLVYAGSAKGTTGQPASAIFGVNALQEPLLFPTRNPFASSLTYVALRFLGVLSSASLLEAQQTHHVLRADIPHWIWGGVRDVGISALILAAVIGLKSFFSRRGRQRSSAQTTPAGRRVLLAGEMASEDSPPHFQHQGDFHLLLTHVRSPTTPDRRIVYTQSTWSNALRRQFYGLHTSIRTTSTTDRLLIQDPHYRLFPPKSGEIVMKYHGWFGDFGAHADYDPNYRLEIELDTRQPESRHGFIRGRLVFAERPGRPVAVDHIWVARSARTAPSAQIRLNEREMRPVRNLASAEAEDRVYYVDEVSGICLSECVIGADWLARKTQEIQEAFEVMERRQGVKAAVAEARELLLRVPSHERGKIVNQLLTFMPLEKQKALRPALLAPYSEVAELLNADVERGDLESLIQRFLREQPERAKRFFEPPDSISDLRTQLPFKINPRGWVWLRREMQRRKGLSVGRADVLASFLDGYLKEQGFAVSGGFFHMSATDLILSTLQSSVLRGTTLENDHYQALRDVLGRWFGPDVGKNLPRAVEESNEPLIILAGQGAMPYARQEALARTFQETLYALFPNLRVATVASNETLGTGWSNNMNEAWARQALSIQVQAPWQQFFILARRLYARHIRPLFTRIGLGRFLPLLFLSVILGLHSVPRSQDLRVSA